MTRLGGPPSPALRWTVTVLFLAGVLYPLAAFFVDHERFMRAIEGRSDWLLVYMTGVSVLLWVLVWRLRPRAYPGGRRPASDGATTARDPDEPVTVLASSDPGLLGVAKSLLEEAGIPFAALNEQTQDLIGVGRVGGFNVAIGPVQIQVEGARAEEALELLSGLRIED